jgi:2-polyprenyl-3-methyl-5-hydroxy-6-metoxy-1,4-benzoquinol methylase
MPPFVSTSVCWICGGRDLTPVHDSVFELSIYRDQDPALAGYSGATVAMVRCGACGFTQPAELPALDRFFARMYDQRWSAEWVAGEFDSEAKTAIFRDILLALEARLPPSRRRLLDVGAHVGKFIAMAAARGWTAEGIELNPTTAAYARDRTGLPVHERSLAALAGDGRRFDAVTLTDVLEHIPNPMQPLLEAARVLVPGGWIAVKVPCGPNQLLKEKIRRALRLTRRVSVADNLVHVSHFSARSMQLALENAGFRAVTLRVGRPERSQTGSRSRRLLSNMFRGAAHDVARVLPGGVRSPLAFNLQAFGHTTKQER